MAEFNEFTLQGMRPSRMGNVAFAYVVRAPKAQWDANLAERVRQSIAVDAQWLRTGL